MKTTTTTQTMNMQEKCLEELNETLIENKRQFITNYFLITNIITKILIIIFICRLCWLNLYYTVITLTIIILTNLLITALYYMYYKKFQLADTRVKFNNFIVTLILSIMVLKYDKLNFQSKINRIFAVKLQLLWNYLLYIPLSLIFIHEFIRIFYLKTIIIIITASTLKIDNITITNTFISTLYATKFDYYFYLLSFISLSSSTIFNIILLKRQLDNENHQNNDFIVDRQLFNENNWLCSYYFNISFLFSFLFRYFFYLARNLSLVMTLIATSAIIKVTSSKVNDIEFSQNKYFYILIGYIIVSFTVYLFFHFFESLKIAKQQNKLETIALSMYHAFIMVCDIDETFFKLQFKKAKYYTKVKIAFFMFLMLTSVTLCAVYWYYWYYCSYNYTLLDSDSLLLVLLNNFSKYKYKLLNSFIYEQQLQDEIKFKQIMLVIICGCMLVSFLSFHIYYNYYFNYNFIDITKLEIFNELKLCTVSSKCGENTINQAFEDHYISTTEITDSTKCSTCYTKSSSGVTGEKSMSVVKYPSKKYDYETSSGVLSTVTSSSCFSSSYEKQFVDNLIDLAGISGSVKTLFTQTNINLHNQSEAQVNQSFYEKVYSWFMKSNSSIDIQQQNRKFNRDSLISQQSTADCSMII
jgi:hypothetical protein